MFKYCTIQLALNKMYCNWFFSSKQFKLLKDQLESKVYKGNLPFKFRKGNSPIISTSLAIKEIQIYLQKVPADITQRGFPYFC